MSVTPSGRLICGTEYQGIYFSDDLGGSWERAICEDEFENISSIQVDPNGNVVALSSLGFIRSNDNGKNWSIAYERYYDYPGTKLLIARSDDFYYLIPHNTLLKSVDSGNTWESVLSGQMDDIAVSSSGSVYTSIRDKGLYRSDDGGNSWNTVDLPFVIPEYNFISDLLSDDSGNVYLKLFSSGNLYRFNEEAESFTFVNEGWTDFMRGITPEGGLILTRGDSLGVYSPSRGVWESLSAPDFIKPYPGGEGNEIGVEIITVDPLLWIANYSERGLFRSEDGGCNWYDINVGLGNQSCIALEVLESGEIYAGTFLTAFWGGVYKSNDEGITWIKVLQQTIHTYIRSIKVLQNGDLLVSAFQGLYRLPADSKDKWIKSEPPGSYAGLIETKSGLLVACRTGLGIYISRDHSASWQEANSGVEHYWLFAFGESESGRIFAGAWPSGAYYSDNEGSNWIFLETSPIANTRVYKFAVLADTIFAGTSNGLLRSIDDGLSWTYIDNIHDPIHELVTGHNGHIIVATQSMGILCSSDGGQTWKDFNKGLEGVEIYDLRIEKSGLVHAATEEGISKNTSLLLLDTDLEAKKEYLRLLPYPNPFNKMTVIHYRLLPESSGTLQIFDLNGRLILTRQILEIPNASLQWYGVASDGRAVPSGVYFIQLNDNYAKGLSITGKVTLLK
ncbi:T9SS type A sorting domain-containing protein [Candidatus Neomarinimicrobiota bacterium]